MAYTVYPSKKPTIDKTRRLLSVQDFPERVVTPSDHHIAYLESHRINPQFLLHYSAYLTEDGVCFVLAGCLGYQLRITTPGLSTRFLFPAGVPLKSALYVPDATRLAGRELIIVEGTTDALAIAQTGYRTVSLLGSNVTIEKVAALKGLLAEVPNSILYMIPDNDLPGHVAAAKLCSLGLTPRIHYLPTYAKDICDLDVTYRETFLERRIVS